MSESGAVYLPNTEAEYTDWFQAHPLGYVINAHKSGAVPMFWHRVGCGHIKPDGVMRFIGGDYLKACALDPGELAVWAKARREPLDICKDCRK